MRAIPITRVLAAYAQQHDCIFTVNGEIEPAVLLFSPEVFLPVIAMHADINARDALGCSLGIEYLEDDQSLLGTSVYVEPLTGDGMSVLRAAFFVRAMHQIFGLTKETHQIECSTVFEAYEHGLMYHIEQNGGMQWPVAIASQR